MDLSRSFGNLPFVVGPFFFNSFWRGLKLNEPSPWQLDLSLLLRYCTSVRKIRYVTVPYTVDTIR